MPEGAVGRVVGGHPIVNPEKEARAVTLERGWKRFAGLQDSKTNSGAPVSGNVMIPPRDGLLLVRQ